MNTNKVYVLGGAQTDFERNWSKEGKNVIALLREVISDGCYDASLTYAQIEQLNKENRIGFFVGNFIAELYANQGHLGALLTEVHPAFYGVPSARYEAACASGSVALDAAITKIRSGDYDVAIVVGWEMMKTVSSKVGGDYLGRAAYYDKEGKGIDFPFPKLFGRLADAYIDRYGEEDRYMSALASIAEINYENAKRNPNAQTRKWFMSREQANMRDTETNMLVGGKLAVSDCSQVTDGAAMVVLCSEKYKEESGLKGPTPVVKGFGHRVAPMQFSKKLEESRDMDYILPWTRQTVVDAYCRAGVTVNDIDFFETHDCFTSSEYAAISAFGITEPGKEYEAVEDGVIAFDGTKPINPSGGLIGCGHPVGASGVRMFLDLYKQIAHKAGDYQLIKADTGCMLNIGGSATTNYVFVMGRE
ncbi:acetyl-CoA acetyltransferase [Intestinibacillus massiliensis]|uniref:acetyl-CoA acetyltransferase n=1 Tax=Intestinibacillus massiliensis TaxID=1871029 RepID=UPI000B356DA9|nr:acetyl-CoA acetyltransferase [Intestinibacillus massiliensis]MCB6365048.1 acetyl-CoA acetyltransferase [Intestinibacillus massiliensis]